MAEPLETELLQGCRDNDSEAQRQVFERYKDQVYSIAIDYLKGDDSAAKDVTQEVFVKVFRGIHTFRETARFTTWLYRIVANACKDELRRRRQLVLVGDVPEHLHPTETPPEPSDLDVRVRKALHDLSPKLRMVVLLRYFQDLSYDEIAAATGVSAGTVASRLNRAHRALEEKLGGDREPRDG